MTSIHCGQSESRLRAEIANFAGRWTYRFGSATGWLWWCGLAGRLDARADALGYWNWHNPGEERRRRWPFGPRLRIWSLSIPLVGTIIRPGRDGFADLATLRRRDYMRAWWLPFGCALIRDRRRGLDL